MDSRIQREYREDVLYVYDRVCSKASKQEQMHRTFRSASSSGEYTSRSSDGRGYQKAPRRVYGQAFAKAQWERAAIYEQSMSGGQRERQNGRPSSYGQAYQYRPGRAQGGEAVANRPLKLMLERIINFFETVEERGKRDEAIAKKKAISLKKLSDYKHIIKTALILIAISVAFVLLVYKMFFVIEDVSISGISPYGESQIVSSAGFAVGDNLYSFSATEAEDSITFHCPYIKSADVTRSVPTSVSVVVEEDTAAYYANIWGDYVKLSAGLRVLEVVEEADVAEEGLIELVLPPVEYAVAGRVIRFADERNDRFIRSVLGDTAASSMAEKGMIDQVDLSNQYNVTMQSCGRYLLRLGDETDCALKLRMAYKTMTSEQFDDLLPSRIDLSEVGQAIIRPDASLSFE